MKAAEAKRKLCEIRSNLTDDEQKQAIWIAIRAIDTCTENGFIVEDLKGIQPFIVKNFGIYGYLIIHITRKSINLIGFFILK